MSSTSWRNALRCAVKTAQKDNGGRRVAVVGVGHELRGDDAVGVGIARALLSLPAQPGWLVVDAGPVPERCLGALSRFQPALVIIVDAAHMGAPAGAVRWLDRWQAEDSGTATHGLPLDLVAEYWRAELGCKVSLLAIEPASDDLDTPLSRPVRVAARGVIGALERLQGVLSHPSAGR